jgi:hypothetical protein
VLEPMPVKSNMKFSAMVMALALLIIAVPFLLERLDIIKADWLRLEPAVIAIVIALAVILMVLGPKWKNK